MKRKILAVICAFILVLAGGAVSAFASAEPTQNKVGITIVKDRDIVYQKNTSLDSLSGFSGAYAWSLPEGTVWVIGLGASEGRLDKVGTLVNEMAQDNKDVESQLS